MNPGIALPSWSLESQGPVGTGILQYNQKPNLEKLFRSRGLEEETKPMKQDWTDARKTKKIKEGTEVKVSGNWKEARDFDIAYTEKG